MASTLQASDQESAQPVRRVQAIIRFSLDWAMVLLSAWWVGGLFLDGWAHRHGKVDESFFTPWHAVLYSGYLAVACLLVVTAVKNWRNGARRLEALPAGYELSMLGIVLFAIGGVADLIWHTLFGIEADTEALLSPTHLVLAAGVLLAISGPARAGGRRPAQANGLVSLLPALLSLAYVLSTLTFMTQFAHPLVDPWAARQPGNADAPSQLYMMDADGTGQTRLSNDPKIQYWNPSYSPDGSKIAYAAGEPHNLYIFVANADGSHPAQLTNSTGEDISPAWSPDGTKIAFSSSRDGQFQVYVMNADGTNQERLVKLDSSIYPAWSPDGRKIAYTGIRGRDWQVYVMNADGSGETRLTNSKGGNYFPQWSPDGSKLLITSQRDGKNQIYIMNADGSHQARLTDNTSDARFGRWSPVGGSAQRIAFASNVEGNFDIYVMNVDGSGLTNLTRNPGMESGGMQSWSPDGSKILFTAQGHPAQQSFLTEELGIASIVLQAGLLAGMVLLALRRWQLPPGSLTLIFTLNALLMSFLEDQYRFIPAAFVAGIICDLLLWRLQPSLSRPGAFHLFAFAMPVIYFSCYFLVLISTQGIAWSIHLWMGSILLAGVVGLFLSFLAAPPGIQVERS